MTENSTCGGNETKHTDLEFQQEASQGQPRPEESFTVFSPGENRLLTYLIGTAMLFSPLSANIYFPSIVVLEKAYHKSTQLINLTVTAYIVVQGISPALLGSVADSLGRRPVFLASFTIYFFANLGLALQSNYAALLVLRMVQSFGCSAHNAISYGVIADVSTPDKRGRMLGPAMVATNLGPILAPVLGGLIVNRASWRWLFWFLLIAGGVFLAILIITLPETARSIVGNGSRLPPKLYRPIISLVGLRQIPKRALSTSESHSILSDLPKPQIPNPLHSLRILAYPDAAFVLSITGTYYTVYYCLQTSMSRSFEQVYKFNELFAGLGYLGIGLGVALGGYLNGKPQSSNPMNFS
jgi:multidrug resistance protein